MDLVRILSWLRLRGRERAPKEWEEALNLLLNESEDEAYRKKEMVVEKLSRMLNHGQKLNSHERSKKAI